MPPTPEPRLTEPHGPLYRVGRGNDPLRFGTLDPIEALRPHGGGRFDVAGAGVLYAATTSVCAFKETIQAYRPSAGSDRFAESGFMSTGSLAAQWRHGRLLVGFDVHDPLPFLDVESDATLTFLSGELAGHLADHGLERLDRSHISSGNRLLTRAIAEWTYAQVDENGDPRYSGIRYCSKFESAECWAIFAGTTIIQQWAEPIEPGHPALEEAARDFGITVH